MVYDQVHPGPHQIRSLREPSSSPSRCRSICLPCSPVLRLLCWNGAEPFRELGVIVEFGVGDVGLHLPDIPERQLDSSDELCPRQPRLLPTSSLAAERVLQLPLGHLGATALAAAVLRRDVLLLLLGSDVLVLPIAFPPPSLLWHAQPLLVSHLSTRRSPLVRCRGPFAFIPATRAA